METFRFSIILLIVVFVACDKIIPEKAELLYTNDKYLVNASVFTTKYGNTSYFNLIGEIKQTWGNNVTVNIVVFEYLRKKYKPTFMQLHLRACDFLNADTHIGAAIVRVGNFGTCPIAPGVYQVINLSIPNAAFRYLFYLNKVMGKLELAITSTRERIGEANFYARVLHDKKNK